MKVCGTRHGPSTKNDRFHGDDGCGQAMLKTPHGAWFCQKCDGPIAAHVFKE